MKVAHFVATVLFFGADQALLGSTAAVQGDIEES